MPHRTTNRKPTSTISSPSPAPARHDAEREKPMISRSPAPAPGTWRRGRRRAGSPRARTDRSAARRRSGPAPRSAAGFRRAVRRMPSIADEQRIKRREHAGSTASPTTAIARMPGTLPLAAAAMPNVAQNTPAVTNIRSPPTPWLPMVASDSAPNTSRPAMMVAPPMMRCARRAARAARALARISPNSAAQAGWMVVPWPSGTRMKPV